MTLYTPRPYVKFAVPASSLELGVNSNVSLRSYGYGNVDHNQAPGKRDADTTP